MRLIIVSGRSGSGKSSALHLLEDEGFTCIDNLPVNLLPSLIEQIKLQSSSERQKFAIGIDARNLSDLSKLPALLSFKQLPDVDCKIIYLDSSREVLLKRFSETRRKHPLSDDKTGLNEAIAKEKAMLEPIANIADFTLDTSALTLHELRSEVKRQVVGKDKSKGVALMFTSFGFKFGLPVDTDFVFDVRCLSNPYWNPELRQHTGLEKPVIDFLDAQEDVQKMYEDLLKFISEWAPRFDNNNRSYMTIAIGCTGGRHRSVYLCEKLAESLRPTFSNVQTRHRQIPQSSTGESH